MFTIFFYITKHSKLLKKERERERESLSSHKVGAVLHSFFFFFFYEQKILFTRQTELQEKTRASSLMISSRQEGPSFLTLAFVSAHNIIGQGAVLGLRNLHLLSCKCNPGIFDCQKHWEPIKLGTLISRNHLYAKVHEHKLHKSIFRGEKKPCLLSHKLCQLL